MRPLFPLPLVPFEQYMLLDDHPDHPMTCLEQLTFSGAICRPAFDEALQEALARHPLLQATVDRSNPRRPCWVSHGVAGPAVDWGDGDAAVTYPHGEAIDLGSEVGLRIWGRHDADAAVLTLQFHHACCDAIGVGRFIEDLLVAYAVRTSGEEDGAALAPLEPARLQHRGRFPRRRPLWVAAIQAIRTLARESVHWKFHPGTPLASPEPGPPDASAPPFPGIHFHRFEEEASRSLRAAAKRRGATLNDLLLAIMFETVAEWNATHGAEPDSPWLRISVPQNLRGPGDERMPAANKVTMCFINRRREACLDRDELLEGIRAETDHMRRWLRGKGLVRAMRAALWVPGYLPRFLARDRCLATVVLSNLGDLATWFCPGLPRCRGRVRAGNLLLESISTVPPLRPKTRAVFCVATYGGRLTVSVRCDGRLFSTADSQALLEAYTSRLAALAQDATGPAAGSGPDRASCRESLSAK